MMSAPAAYGLTNVFNTFLLCAYLAVLICRDFRLNYKILAFYKGSGGRESLGDWAFPRDQRRIEGGPYEENAGRIPPAGITRKYIECMVSLMLSCLSWFTMTWDENMIFSPHKRWSPDARREGRGEEIFYFHLSKRERTARATYLVPRWSQGVMLRARRPPARHFASFSPLNIRISSKV